MLVFTRPSEEDMMPLRNAWPPQLPPLSDFLLSPGFGGGLVVLAAVIVFLAAFRRETRRLDKQLGMQDKHHQEIRADGQRREAIERCWQRLVWLVKSAGAEPAELDADEASLGLGPELTLAILEGLHRDSKELADDTLAEAVAVYLSQYGLVLGQRVGSLPDVLPEVNGRPKPPADGDLGGGDPVPATANSASAKSSTSKAGQQ
jgi:hypothetical protein